MRNYKKYIFALMAAGILLGEPGYSVMAQQNDRVIHSGEMGCGMDFEELGEEEGFDVEESFDTTQLRNFSRVKTMLGSEQLTTSSPFTPLTYSHEEKFTGYTLFNGIDVSHWQSEIDWEKAHESGVDFAIVRVGHRNGATGIIEEDKRYKENLKNAVKNNVNVGVYIYSQAITEKEAIQEAKYVLKRIKKYDVTLPIVMDYEYDSSQPDGGRLYKAKLSQKKASKICLAFCNVVREAGYEPMIYANSSFLISQLSQSYLKDKNPIWQARYDTTTKPGGTYVIYNGPYDMWQYSSKGRVGGINTNVDCNFMYLDLEKKPNKPYTVVSAATEADLKWSSVNLASGYEVLRFNPESGEYETIGKTKNNQYDDEGLSPASVYDYKVMAYWTIGGTKYYSKQSSVCEVVTNPSKVKELKVDSYKTKNVELSWKPAKGATGYMVYIFDKAAGKYEKYTTITGDTTSCNIENLDSATEYRFYVRSYFKKDGATYYGANSSTVVTVTRPGMVNGLKAHSKAKKSISLSWNKVSRCSGYLVYRYDKETDSYEKIATVKGTKNLTYTDTGLKKNKKYQYKVCAYKKVDDKVYKGNMSEEISSKTKK